MKKFIVSAVAVLAMGAFAVAGGEIVPASSEPIMPAVENDNGFYMGLAYGSGRLREDYSGDYYGGYLVFEGTQKIDYDTIMLQAGYKVNTYLALEGRYWRSYGDNGWSITESGYSAGQPYSNFEKGANGDNLKAFGLYAKPMYPLTEELDIYALLGYGNVTLNDDDNGDWLDENSFQAGFGISYALTKNISMFVDYMRLLDKDYFMHTGTQIGGSDDFWNDTLHMVSIGLTYKF
jgi:opacity protein-like surface antigen